MFTYVVSFFLIVWEFLCCKLLVEVLAEKRVFRRKYMPIVFYALFIVVEYVATGVLQNALWLKIIVVIATIAIIMGTVFRLSILKALMLCVLFQGINLLSDGIVLLLMANLFPEKSPLIMSNTEGQYLVSIISKMILLLLILIIRRKIGKKTEDMLDDIEWLGFLLIPTITILAVVGISLRYNIVSGAAGDDVLLYVALGMAAMNFMVFFLLELIFKREKIIRENRVMSEKMKKETEMYYSISENLDTQRKMTHEFRNHIACIDELLRKENYTELVDYTKKLNSNLLERVDMVDTNNVIINAIINTKYREASEKGIAFILKIGDLSGLSLDDMDAVTILSNMLSNAIEACEQCEEKILKLKFVIENNETIIGVNNTIMKQPQKVGNQYVTSKRENSESHGYGINNVIEVVEKYNGRYLLEYDEKKFSFTIII